MQKHCLQKGHKTKTSETTEQNLKIDKKCTITINRYHFRQ